MSTITIDDVLNNDAKSCKKGKVWTMQNIEASLFLWIEQLVTQQFKWKNIPESIPFYTLEKGLFYYGAMVFFKVGENYFALPCTQAQSPNLYSEPLDVYANGFNGYQYKKPIRVADNYDYNFNLISKAEGVLIRNNEQMLSTYAIIKPYVNRLMYIWQSIGILECLGRVKLLIHANKDLSTAMKKMFDAIFDSGSPIVVINDKQYTDDKMDTLQFDSSFDATNYWDDFDNTLSLLLTVLGIKNLNQKDKKERLSSSEVDNNDELVGISRETRLAFRKDSTLKINKLFNLNCEVEYACASESAGANTDTGAINKVNENDNEIMKENE